MRVSYFYCTYCGYEMIDVFVAYYTTCANGDFYLCPEYKKESSNFKI